MKVITCISNPHQIGYINGLLASCKHFDLQLTTLLIDDWHTHRKRDLSIYPYLLTLDPEELVFLTDGYDVIFVANEKEILQKYDRLAPKQQVLISADRICSPDLQQANNFVATRFGYNYLNCGGIVGKTKDILEIINEVQNIALHDKSLKNKEYVWSNQYLWTQVFLSKKFDIVLDGSCEIFQTMTTPKSLKYLYNFVNSEPPLDEFEDLYKRQSLQNTLNDMLSEVEISEIGKLVNKSTNSNPCHIHFNSKIHKLTMFMEPFVKLFEFK